MTIVTENVFHAEQAITALNHGKHVLCEKPLAMNTAEAREMTNAADKSGKVHQVAFTFRYGCAIGELRRRLRAGDIGKPFYLRIQYDGWDGLQPDWQTGWREKQSLAGGGMLYDLGAHLFDIARFVLGPISSVSGFTHSIPRCRIDKRTAEPARVETDDLAAVWFTQPHGVRGQWFASRITPPFAQNGYVEVIGPQGALKASLSRGKFDLLKISRPTSPSWEELPLPAAVNNGEPHCLATMMRSFVEACLRGHIDEELDASFEDGLAVQQCIEDVLRFQEQARSVGEK